MTEKNFHLPQANDIKKVLGMLFGNATNASDANVLDPSGANVFTATYVDDNDELVAICSCDSAFAAYAGGALSMVPVGGAKEMAQTNDFFPAIIENLNEIMNIVSTAFMSDSSDHLRLDKLYHPADMPPEMMAAVVGSAHKKGVSVEVPGYGAGALTLVTI